MKGTVYHRDTGKLTVVRDESRTKNDVGGGYFLTRCEFVKIQYFWKPRATLPATTGYNWEM